MAHSDCITAYTGYVIDAVAGLTHDKACIIKHRGCIIHTTWPISQPPLEKTMQNAIKTMSINVLFGCGKCLEMFYSGAANVYKNKANTMKTMQSSIKHCKSV